MLQNILKLNGVKELENKQKEIINGGGWGNFGPECEPNNCNPDCHVISRGCQ